jgi:regulator of protease activity HflC (stomatin/prohibitin superfamily)
MKTEKKYPPTSKEKRYAPVSGYLMLALIFILLAGGTIGLISARSLVLIFPIVIAFLTFPGFFFVNPNSAVVLVLFGEYKGTVKSNGFFWVNPFFSRSAISLRARNFDSDKIKVNDKLGNPIQIGVILVWQVRDTFKASFDVDNY